MYIVLLVYQKESLIFALSSRFTVLLNLPEKYTQKLAHLFRYFKRYLES